MATDTLATDTRLVASTDGRQVVMLATRDPGETQDLPVRYEIRVRGVLDPAWSEWFDGMSITLGARGDTTLAGPVADQAALYGLIARLRDLGLTLVALTCDEADLDHVGGEPLPSDRR